jgi:hypothetical protein
MNTTGSRVLSSPPILNVTASLRFWGNGKPLREESTTNHEPKQDVARVRECWSWITKIPEFGPSGGGCVSSAGFLRYSEKLLVMYIVSLNRVLDLEKNLILYYRVNNSVEQQLTR